MLHAHGEPAPPALNNKRQQISVLTGKDQELWSPDSKHLLFSSPACWAEPPQATLQGAGVPEEPSLLVLFSGCIPGEGRVCTPLLVFFTCPNASDLPPSKGSTVKHSGGGGLSQSACRLRGCLLKGPGRRRVSAALTPARHHHGRWSGRHTVRPVRGAPLQAIPGQTEHLGSTTGLKATGTKGHL